jgi:RecA-family ATPase
MKLDGLKWVSLGDLLDRQWPKREFVIGPWLYAGESVLIWADTGVGKTWLTLSLAVAIAGGGKVWQYEAPKPRKVMIIDGEMHAQEFTERARELVLGGKVRGLDVEELRRNVTVCARQGQAI